jgi:diguanylate cyclase (GGDEF)-like protein/PAS domain S-box-containing protein
MHRLLLRQLQRHLGKNFVPEGEWQSFLDVISRHYYEVDQERGLLENALEVNSQELTGVNEQLVMQSKREHALLRGLLDSIPDLIFFKTPASTYLGCNRAFEKYLGLLEINIVGKTDFELLDTETAHAFHRMEMEMQAKNQAIINEEWISYPDHKKVCLEVLRTPYFSVDGTLLGLIGVGRDITLRKRLEEGMRIANMVYQHSGEGMLVTDADNRIVSMNPACTRITGYSLSEVEGKDPKIFNSGRQDSNFYASMWQMLNQTGHWRGELWDKHKNGQIYAKSMSINALAADDGSPHGYVALFSDITEKKQSEEVIWRQANFDGLTGLPNRRMLRDRLEQEIKKAERSGFSLALLFIDLDHFKEINDTLGHHIGDELLVEAGRRITQSTRETDTVARLGGDEFTVVLTQLADNTHVEEIAQAIIAKLAEPFVLGDEIAYVSASIGITLYPTDARDVEQLLKNADQAMYVAKSLGRNRFSYFTYALQEAAQKRLRLISDLHGALAANQFRVHFQPIVDLATNRIHKAEALVRWQHPERGMVAPAEFIHYAEETGLIAPIGDWVFRESARWAKSWADICPKGFQVSVNKSPVQFRVEGNIYEDGWLEYLQKIGLSGNSIVIEITEGLLLKVETDVANKLLKLRDAGIQVAIDDFGTGYSSLAYLKKFDIDYLKIDQSFVRNLASDANDMALSEAIIVMAHKLGLKVIAEGVETEEQRKFLTDDGCDSAQGYLFSRPIPPDEFEVLLRQGLSVALENEM